MSTYAQLHPKYIFGLNQHCKGTNVWFLDNNTILYPAGNSVVILSLDQKTQIFLHGVEKGRGVTALTVSHNKLYAAVAQLGDKPSIVVFDLKTNKRRKTLQFTDTIAQEYTSMAFTHDTLHLATLTGAPEYNLVFWKWDRSRMICFVKTTGGAGPVLEVSTSPIENNVMCAIGKSSFRFFRFNESHMKPFGFQKGDAYNFLCHAWLGKGDKLVAGTADGRLMLFERGDYKHDIAIKNITTEVSGSMKAKTSPDTNKDRYDTTPPANSSGVAGSTLSSAYEGTEVTAIVAYNKGFAVGVSVGTVVLFEEQLVYETPEDHYKQVHIIRIPVLTSVWENRVIKSLGISPNEEIIVATTYNCQIFTFSLSSAEIKDPNDLLFDFANCPYHFGSVVSMDVAIRKSILVSCGADKFIRVWNFLTLGQEASREFTETINVVSIHPTGLYLLAGFTDKVRMFTILMEDIRELKEWQIRACMELRFSNGGHLFAAANGNIIQLYSTTTLENVCSMKGHSNRIKKITWTLDDSRLVTAGADGAIYEWDVHSGKRTADVVERGSHLISVVVSPDNKTHYAINSNNLLKEIQIHEGMILKELDLGVMPNCICMSRSGKILLSGLQDGTVRSFRQPLTYAGEWFDYHLHLGSVNTVICTFDEIFCISCSSDNSIVLWKMTDAEGRMSKLEKDLNYSSEVLITRQDLDERQVTINDLRQRYSELKMEMDYQLKRRDMTYQDEIKELNIHFTDQIVDLNQKLEDLEGARDRNEEDYTSHMQEITDRNTAMMDNLEAHFNTKVISEFEKYNALQYLLEQTIKEYESRIAKLEDDRRQAIEELVEYFERKITDKNSALEQAVADARTEMMESDEMKKQIEDDADQEILEVTTTFERKLKHERELNTKLRGDAIIKSKKFHTMLKDIEEQKNEVQRLLVETSKLKTVIQTLEKQIATLKKEMLDRDENIADKEKIYNEMKKQNTELEKFKYVLDYKVKELKKVIEPKEREIIYLKQQNTDMESELDQTIVVRNGLQLQVNELTRKLRVTDEEYQVEKRMRWTLNVLVQRIRSHMSRAMGVLQDHKALKTCVKAMYTKYGHSVEVGKASTAEQEAICELVRQKNHLEMCLTSVKRKLSKDVEFTRSEQLKIMHENMLLVYEINNLRRELKTVRDKISSYENMLGVTQTSQAAEVAEMRLKLQNAVEDRDEVDIAHEDIVEAKENTIEAQQYEIDSLSTKIMKIHEFVNDARPGISPTSAIDYLRSVLSSNY